MVSIRPSWKNGFARCAAESANPNLWKGLVGAWYPSLGPTGLTLRDVSGWHNHGTLTNMDPATDWVATEMGWALDFDGDDDKIPFDQTITLPGDFTIIAQLLDRSDGQWHSIVSGSGFFYLTHDVPPRVYYYDVNLELYSTTTVAVDKWATIGWVRNGTRAAIYINGVETDTGITTAPSCNVRSIGHIQAAQYFDGQLSRVTVWNRALIPSEIWDIYSDADPDALVRLRSRVPVSAGAAPAFGGPGNVILGGGMLAG